MYTLLTGVIFIILFTEYGNCIQTKTFMANENLQGYSEKLLIKTINEHFPEFDTSDKKALTKLISTGKVQILLRNAAVKEIKSRVESQLNRKYFDEPLNDRSYCNYDWLSWLPWLSCPQKTKDIPPLRYYQKTCY